MTHITLDDMIADRIDTLLGVFEMDDLAWYRHNIDINNLSVDDSLGYLSRKAWTDVQHKTLKPIYNYFKEYIEKYGMKIEE